DACSGYHYSDSTLLGFSHTHLSGTGCIDLGDILFHPTVTGIQAKPEGYLFEPLSFSHKNELASPGYYRVKLDNGILAELTATMHVGVHRYTFPDKGQPKIIIDLAHLLENETIIEAEIQMVSGEIAGMRRTSGWVANQYIYFVAQFSEKFDASLISGGETVSGVKTVAGKNLQAVITFPENNREPVVCKVGLSLVSVENARLNLQAETKGFDFDKIKSEAENTWNQALSAFRISGGKSEEITNFYTALYHSMIAPNVVSDANHDYRGADQQIHRSQKPVYSTMSLWDTFRAWNPLMTLTDTTLVNQMINSFLNFYDQTGELPIWPLSSGETGTMIGYHSVSVIYDAYSKNIRGFDAKKAFEAMKVSAE
ncbi:MAG: GH92 family glycosyl hydrolase, partial [Flavobacteriaceae bacterium]|nr:GH92 family glycosyl hydrolase [Flavobacteriaceae bacterium]